jgi:hypothetical protein
MQQTCRVNGQKSRFPVSLSADCCCLIHLPDYCKHLSTLLKLFVEAYQLFDSNKAFAIATLPGHPLANFCVASAKAIKPPLQTLSRRVE